MRADTAISVATILHLVADACDIAIHYTEDVAFQRQSDVEGANGRTHRTRIIITTVASSSASLDRHSAPAIQYPEKMALVLPPPPVSAGNIDISEFLSEFSRNSGIEVHVANESDAILAFFTSMDDPDLEELAQKLNMSTQASHNLIIRHLSIISASI